MYFILFSTYGEVISTGFFFFCFFLINESVIAANIKTYKESGK